MSGRKIIVGLGEAIAHARGDRGMLKDQPFNQVSIPEDVGLQDGMLSYYKQQASSTDAHADARIAGEYFDFLDQLRPKTK